MKITLYFDEDAQDSDLIQALNLRGVAVIGAWAAGMRERNDEEHLLWAAAENRSLYSFNVRDYCRLHAGISRPRQVTRRDYSRQATALAAVGSLQVGQLSASMSRGGIEPPTY